jgi:hypothetical protein
MSLLLYVDPGSGLLVWQMIVAALVGTLFYVKKFRALMGKLGRRFLGRNQFGGIVSDSQPNRTHARNRLVS